MRGEFALIARYFAPLAAGAAGAQGLRNDAALLDLGPEESAVVTVDAMVAGVHFLPEDPPDLVARKLLRVNLSDLAAMGAEARGYVMTLALPRAAEEGWVAAFVEGLAADQREFGVALLGGDTVSTPGPLSLSLTALGAVPRGRSLQRATAAAGDAVFVSGTIGDGVFGLRVLQGEFQALSQECRDTLADRYRLPRPRLALGQRLLESGLASAALDVSDGLVADLGHIAEESGLGAEIAAESVPLSDAAAAVCAVAPERRATALTGGDDYELLFTVPPDRAAEVDALAADLALPLTRIGRMTEGDALRVLDAAGRPLDLAARGWTHF